MLDFVKRAFRGGINVLLWINLILWTIGGGIAGYYLGTLISYRNGGGYAFGGVLIGIIFGLLTDIFMGGFIATILSIDENIKQLRQKFIGDITPNESLEKVKEEQKKRNIIKKSQKLLKKVLMQ